MQSIRHCPSISSYMTYINHNVRTMSLQTTYRPSIIIITSGGFRHTVQSWLASSPQLHKLKGKLSAWKLHDKKISQDWIIHVLIHERPKCMEHSIKYHASENQMFLSTSSITCECYYLLPDDECCRSCTPCWYSSSPACRCIFNLFKSSEGGTWEAFRFPAWAPSNAQRA